MYKWIILLVLIASVQYLNAYDWDSDDDDEVKRELLEKEEAMQFFKRLFHPFSTKNEEIKRETYEVYEEKCKSIVPTQRFCPRLKSWKDFKNYENGE